MASPNGWGPIDSADVTLPGGSARKKLEELALVGPDVWARRVPPVGPPPPFDPEVAAALAALPNKSPTEVIAAALARHGPLPESLPALVEAFRDSPGATEPTDDDLSHGGEYAVTRMSVPRSDGTGLIELVVCRPAADAAMPRPLLYTIHGGGMISGTSRTGLQEQLELARPVGAVIVSVEYRLAPEHPSPAPAEDCYDGLLGFLREAERFDVDPHGVVVVGSSAGGCFAAAVCLMARDLVGPEIAGQLLMTPMLDARNSTRSSYQLSGVDTWDRDCNDLGWMSLLGPGRDPADASAYESPSLADNLSSLPPAFLDVGSAETFRDEVVAYAGGIWAAGGSAELHVWPGGFHGYEVVAPQSRIAQRTWDARSKWLQQQLQL